MKMNLVPENHSSNRLSVASLFDDVRRLHGANVLSARQTAVSAILIGVRLLQLKELVPHGGFEAAITAEVSDLSYPCANNYMRLARERLIRATALSISQGVKALGKPLSVGDSPADFDFEFSTDVLQRARKEVASISWLKVDVGANKLLLGLKGQQISRLYQAYGIIRKTKRHGKTVGVPELAAGINRYVKRFLKLGSPLSKLTPRVREQLLSDLGRLAAALQCTNNKQKTQ